MTQAVDQLEPGARIAANDVERVVDGVAFVITRLNDEQRELERGVGRTRIPRGPGPEPSRHATRSPQRVGTTVGSTSESRSETRVSRNRLGTAYARRNSCTASSRSAPATVRSLAYAWSPVSCPTVMSVLTDPRAMRWLCCVVLVLSACAGADGTNGGARSSSTTRAPAPGATTSTTARPAGPVTADKANSVCVSFVQHYGGKVFAYGSTTVEAAQSFNTQHHLGLDSFLGRFAKGTPLVGCTLDYGVGGASDVAPPPTACPPDKSGIVRADVITSLDGGYTYVPCVT